MISGAGLSRGWPHSSFPGASGGTHIVTAFLPVPRPPQGRVRTKTVKRASRHLIENYYQRLTMDFDTNKRIIDEVRSAGVRRARSPTQACPRLQLDLDSAMTVPSPRPTRSLRSRPSGCATRSPASPPT